jgi:hypothetical protein
MRQIDLFWFTFYRHIIGKTIDKHLKNDTQTETSQLYAAQDAGCEDTLTV